MIGYPTPQLCQLLTPLLAAKITYTTFHIYPVSLEKQIFRLGVATAVVNDSKNPY